MLGDKIQNASCEFLGQVMVKGAGAEEDQGQQGCCNHAGNGREDGEENCRLSMGESSSIRNGDESGKRVT